MGQNSVKFTTHEKVTKTSQNTACKEQSSDRNWSNNAKQETRNNTLDTNLRKPTNWSISGEKFPIQR